MYTCNIVLQRGLLSCWSSGSAPQRGVAVWWSPGQCHRPLHSQHTPRLSGSPPLYIRMYNRKGVSEFKVYKLCIVN